MLGPYDTPTIALEMSICHKSLALALEIPASNKAEY